MNEEFITKLKKQFPKLKKSLEKIEHEQDNTKLVHDLGFELMQKQAYNKAIICFKFVLSKVEFDYHSLLNLAVIKYQQKELEEALALFKKTSSHHPKKSTPYLNAGYILFELNKKEEGFESLYKVVELDESNGQVCEVLGYYTLVNNKYEECIKVGSLAAQRGKPGYGFLYSGIANLMLSNKKDAIELISASYWAFENKQKFFNELDECEELISQVTSYEDLREEILSQISLVEEKGPQDYKSIFSFWSAGINNSEYERTPKNLKHLNSLGYPSEFIEWLKLGDHTYSSEVISGDIGEGFMFNILNSSEIINHLDKKDVSLLFSCGFLIFGHEAYDEYYLFDKEDSFRVYRVFPSPVFGEKIPAIDQIIETLKLSSRNDWKSIRNFLKIHYLKNDKNCDQLQQFMIEKSKVILVKKKNL